MKKRQKEAILISFLHEKEKYKELGEYITQFIQDDPSSPKESFHTTLYRIKDESRLIEKIDIQNNALGAGEERITKKNYRVRIGDLLGIRIICLRLSDVEKVESYLRLLSEENILNLVKGPDQKRSFILPVDPGESISGGLDITYSGYSSIHYQVELGQNSDAPSRLEQLRFEIQLRTILEEAWGEIDHKYRYINSRSGVTLPDYIHTGFYNLSAYLQVAALQAEYLCRSAESLSIKRSEKASKTIATPDASALRSGSIGGNRDCQGPLAPAIEKNLQQLLGFTVTRRTLAYIERRLAEIATAGEACKIFHKVFTKDRLHEFTAIFHETLNLMPFENIKQRNIDVINAVNFAIFDEIQGRRIAQEGLRSVLRWRKARS